MKKDQRELAAELIGTTGEHLEAHFQDLNTSLNESLADTLRPTTPEEAHANKVMLDDIVSLLPHGGKENVKHVPATLEGVYARNLGQVRWLQGSLVWEQDRFGDGKSTPFYLIGAQKFGRRVNLLLHGVEGLATGQLHVAPDVSRTSHEQAHNWMDRQRRKPVTAEELSMFSHNEGYWVTSHQGSGIFLGQTGRFDTQRVSKTYTGADSIIMYSKKGRPQLDYVTEEQLGSYNVFEYLGELAAGFGITDEVQAIITSSVEED